MGQNWDLVKQNAESSIFCSPIILMIGTLSLGLILLGIKHKTDNDRMSKYIISKSLKL
jgi:hypothetical protein